MGETRSFKLSPIRLWFAGSVVVFLAAIPFLLVIGAILHPESNFLMAAGILAVIMLPFAGFLGFCVWYPTLFVGPAGVTVRGCLGFSTVVLPWENIERLRLSPATEALILRNPLEDRLANKLRNWAGTTMAGAPLFNDEQRQLIAEGRYVPVEPYAWWFEHGELLNTIRQFSPALVEHFAEDRKAARAADSSKKTVIIIVSAITAVALTIAVLAGLYSDDLSPETRSRLDGWGNSFEAVAGWGLAVVFTLYGVVNLINAYGHLRKGNFGIAFLWFAMGVIQLLLCLAILGSKMTPT